MKKMLIMAVACLMAAMTFAAQCAATTKKGTQCKRQASPGSQYCWQHGGTTKAERTADGEAAPVQTRRTNGGAVVASAADGRCQATTKAGTQCKRKAQAGGKYCAQHAVILGGTEAETPAAKPAKKTAEADVAAPAATGLCQGKTKNGEPCKRKAKAGSKFCWQHDK